MEGIRVVELGVWIAGPAAGLILADWGADVVKIEPPGTGDPARTFSRMLGGDLPFNPPFEMDNRSKRSIAIDLTRPSGHALAVELALRADVFVTNVRPGALARLGPDADRAAYDIAAFWARSGVAGLLTQPGGQPPLQRGGMGDHGAGLSATAGICAALFARERTGRGQLVSTSLLRQGLYTISFDLATALRFGVSLAVGNRTTMGNPTINCYRDRDEKWFWIVGLEGDPHNNLLRRPQREVFLDRRPGGRPPRASPRARGGPPGVARRSALRDA